MDNRPLIGGIVLAMAAAGVVVFYFVMSSGDSSELTQHERTTVDVQKVTEGAAGGDVVGERAERPEDPVQAKLEGKWDAKVHGEMNAQNWDEVMAVKSMQDRAVMESEIEGFVKGIGGDVSAVRAIIEDINIKRDAVNAEAREGWLNPRQARKKHEAIRAEAEKRMVETLGEAEAKQLKDALGKKQMRFF